MDIGKLCEANGKATVTISYGKNLHQIFKTSETPITVNHTEIADAGEEYCSEKKCYRFYATTDQDVIFEHYVRAYSANYKSDPSLINNGAWLIADGELLNGTSYFYWQGTFGDEPSRTTYSRGIEVISQIGTRQGSSTGDCNCSACKIEIKNKDDSVIYNKTVVSPCDVKVDCGDCPKGYIKCEHPRYPGYCCIPCEGTAAKINSIANKIR